MLWHYINNHSDCSSSQIKMFCILIWLLPFGLFFIPMRILVPHRRGRTSAVIFSSLHITIKKVQTILITKDVMTRQRSQTNLASLPYLLKAQKNIKKVHILLTSIDVIYIFYIMDLYLLYGKGISVRYHVKI